MEWGQDEVEATPESRRYRGDVGSIECGVWNTEDYSIGVWTWFQLICCALTGEQGCPQSQRRQAGETQGDCIVRGENNRKGQGTIGDDKVMTITS